VVEAAQRGLIVFLARDVEQLFRIANAVCELLQGRYDAFQRLALLAEILRALGIVPDVRVFRELRDLAQPDLLLVEVKDTSAARRRDSRRPSAALQ
jgi:hypothetical protein